MNLSMKWLNDFVKIDMKPRDFCEGMTISGSKVEGYELENSEIQNVVVGKVNSMERHPDSDHLWICQIDVGEEEVQIVTGAQNVQVGDYVPVAKHKSLLPNGVKITKGKLRGVESYGMLCSLGELNLTVNDFPYAIADGIFILGDDCDKTVGMDICKAIGLDDMCVEFEITSNRPDCLSVRGLAREAAATFNSPLNLPKPTVKANQEKVEDYISVEVENKELCKRYMAAVVKNVKVGASPRYIRERLRASGVRPINNIVDITNYVMLEYGHPMHAFDLANIKNNKIVVRNAKAGEILETLDDTDRNLSEEMLVIADEEKPTAVAGVMGGKYSGISDETNTVVFEAACFEGSSVRLTAKKLGMRTESSARFEKGLDSRTCQEILARACQLIEELGVGEVISGVIDIDNDNTPAHTIKFEPDWTNRFLGVNIDRNEMTEILKKLDVTVDGDTITVPSYRKDLEHKADIAEEIARIYGYNKIPTTALSGFAQGGYSDRQKFTKNIGNNLQGMGANEIITYSFISPKLYDKIHLESDSKLRNSVTILNPLGEDSSIMRTTALPSMLDILSRNYNNRNPQARLYEIAKEYLPTSENELPTEKTKVILGFYGKNEDFYTIKGVVEAMLQDSGIENVEYVPEKNNPSYHPGRAARIVVCDTEIGIIGEIHPTVADEFSINAKVYVAEIDEDTIYSIHNKEKKYSPLPKFPASTRDIAVICDEELPVAEIEKVIKKQSGKILEKLEIFDVYRGSQLGEGKKSVAYALTLRSSERTLTVEECDTVMNKIINALETIGASIRK